MAEQKFGIKADPDGKFRKALADASAAVSDLTVPLMTIARMWFKGNKAIFALKGPGKFKDLSPKYILFKERHLGTAYPILRLSGQLEASITDPADGNAVAQVINKQVLYLGSKVKYAQWLQTGTKRGTPSRPYVLIGAEQTGPPEFNARFDAFADVLFSYTKQVLQQRMKAGV